MKSLIVRAALIGALLGPGALLGGCGTGNGGEDNGERVVFTSSRDGNSEIYIMRSGGKSQTRLTFNGARDFQPVLRPDGREIIFTSDRDGDYELYRMSPDGSNVERLTSNSDLDADPAYSPDGSHIVFVSDRDGDDEIYLMNLATGATRQLTFDASNDETPTFSPDSQTIAWASDRDGDYEIYTMNINSTAAAPLVSQLTQNIWEDDSPSFSPVDATRLAWATNRHGDYEIYEMDPRDGSSFRRLTFARGDDSFPVYSRDGLRLYFDSERDGTPQIWTMDLSGNNQRWLTKPGVNTNPDTRRKKARRR